MTDKEDRVFASLKMSHMGNIANAIWAFAFEEYFVLQLTTFIVEVVYTSVHLIENGKFWFFILIEKYQRLIGKPHGAV